MSPRAVTVYSKFVDQHFSIDHPQEIRGMATMRRGVASASPPSNRAESTYRPGFGLVLNQMALGASERAATMSGQPSPSKSANASP
jgi:hypothetical protein